MIVDDETLQPSEDAEELLYTPSIELMNFLEEVYKDNTIKILNIFQDFAELNNIYHNRNKFYNEKLEQRLLDIITVSNTNDDAVAGIELYINRAIDEYLKRYNIELYNITDISVFESGKILNGLATLFKVDIPVAQELLLTIDNDLIENEERFSNILASYTDMSESRIYELIKEVDDEWFKSMGKYYRALVRRGYEQVNNYDIEKLQPLVAVDSNFSTTKIATDVLYYGYTEYLFDDVLDDLYFTLNKYQDDSYSMALEIVATNYLSKDKPLSTQDQILNIINFKSLDVDYKLVLSSVIPLCIELMNKIKG